MSHISFIVSWGGRGAFDFPHMEFFSLARYPTSPQRATELNMWPWYSAFAVLSPQLDSSSARRWGSLAGEKLVEGGRFEETRDVFLFA